MKGSINQIDNINISKFKHPHRKDAINTMINKNLQLLPIKNLYNSQKVIG